ncbi:hypothetical protein ACN9S9_11085 [Lactococcus lactis]
MDNTSKNNKQKVSNVQTEPIDSEDFKYFIYPIGQKLSSLETQIKNLESRLEYEMTTRDKIMESTKTDTQWKITTFVAIVLGILAVIFK